MLDIKLNDTTKLFLLYLKKNLTDFKFISIRNNKIILKDKEELHYIENKIFENLTLLNGFFYQDLSLNEKKNENDHFNILNYIYKLRLYFSRILDNKILIYQSESYLFYDLKENKNYTYLNCSPSSNFLCKDKSRVEMISITNIPALLYFHNTKLIDKNGRSTLLLHLDSPIFEKNFSDYIYEEYITINPEKNIRDFNLAKMLVY